MKIYEIKIKPKSAFLTELKGDTLFGAICCYTEKLPDLLKNYSQKPFLIVSSAFFKRGNDYIFKRPCMPGKEMFPNQNVENRKENQSKKFFFYSGQGPIILNQLKWLYRDEDSLISNVVLSHNTINRLTATTGEGEFAPYSAEGFFYNVASSLHLHKKESQSNTIEIIIFAAIDESRFSKKELEETLKKVGSAGFGKRASIGYGQFDVEVITESAVFSNLSGGNFLYALSPFVLSDIEKANINTFYFQPFTRYGKHGGKFANSAKPFKKPIIMADEAAIISLKTPIDLQCPIIGKAIFGVSDIQTDAVAQGYCLCLPCLIQN